MKNLSLATGFLILAIVTGCASYDGANLIPGRSTAAEAQATMGNPAEKTIVGDDTLFWYPRQNQSSRESYAVRIGPDNIVKSVEQRLTVENMKRIALDKTTQQELRALMGPPYYVVRYPNRDGDSWEYRMGTGAIDNWMVLSVRFDGAGITREVTYVADQARNDRDDGVVYHP